MLFSKLKTTQNYRNIKKILDDLGWLSINKLSAEIRPTKCENNSSIRMDRVCLPTSRVEVKRFQDRPLSRDAFCQELML